MSLRGDALIAQLKVASSQVAAVADLPDDNQFVFNFLNATKAAVGEGGFLVPATASTYPALLTGNGAMVVGVMGPCGLNTPHTHPRATEIQIVTSNGPIQTGMMMENGARVVNNMVPLGSATVFPKGSVHFQQNLACEPTVFVSSFDYYDPGTGQSAQQLFGMDQGVVAATLGDLGVNVLDNLKIPSNVAKGAQECFDRCHIDRSTFNFTSSFADFIAFSNSTWTVPSPLPASVSSSLMSKQTGVLATNANQGSANNISFNQNPLKNTVIGLSAASAALTMACMGMLIMLCMRRRKPTRTFAPPPIATYSYTTPYDDTERLTEMHTPMHTPNKP